MGLVGWHCAEERVGFPAEAPSGVSSEGREPALPDPVEARVVDAAGEPLHDIRVFFGTEKLVALEGGSRPGTFTVPLTTARCGRFEVTKHADDTCVLFYEPDVPLPPPGEELILRAPEVRDLQVWINEHDGRQSWAEWEVGWIHPADGHFVRSAKSHYGGRWTLRVPSHGDTLVRIRSAAEVRERWISAVDGEVCFEVTALGSIQVTTELDRPAPEGEGFSHHFVLRSLRAPDELQLEDHQPGEPAVFEDLSPGTYELQLILESWEFEAPLGPIVRVELTPEETVELDYPPD